MSLSARQYENAIVLPSIELHNTSSLMMGGVYCDDIYIDSSCRRFKAPCIDFKNKISKKIIYAGELQHPFGHFLLESLSRFWFIKNCNLPVVFTLNKNLKPYQEEILSILNFKNEIIFVDEPTQFDCVFVPDLGYILNYYFNIQHSMALRAYNAKEIVNGKKLYISRSKLSTSSGGYTNEKEIENTFIEQGFQIFHPQEHSVVEQLAEISSAEICAGIEGSAFHSLVLINGLKTRFYILPRMRYPDYGIIATTNKIPFFELQCKYSLGHKSPLNRTHDRYLCDIESISTEIRRIISGTKFVKIAKRSKNDHIIKECCNTDRLYFFARNEENKKLQNIMYYEITKTSVSQKMSIEYAESCIHTGKNIRNALFTLKYKTACVNFSNYCEIIAKIYSRCNSYSYAEKYALMAVQNDSKRLKKIELYLDIMYKNKNYDGIINYCIKFLAGNKFSPANYYLSLAYEKKKKFDLALFHINVAMDSSSERIRYKIQLENIKNIIHKGTLKIK